MTKDSVVLDDWDWILLGEIQELKNSEGDLRPKVKQSYKELMNELTDNFEDYLLDQGLDRDYNRLNCERFGTEIEAVKAVYKVPVEPENKIYSKLVDNRNINDRLAEIKDGESVIHIDLIAEIDEESLRIRSGYDGDQVLYSNSAINVPDSKFDLPDMVDNIRYESSDFRTSASD